MVTWFFLFLFSFLIGERGDQKRKENDRNLHLNYMEFDVNTRYPSDIKLQGGWKYN